MKILIRGLNVIDNKLKWVDVCDGNRDIKSIKKIIKSKFRQFKRCRFTLSCNGRIAGSENIVNENFIYTITPLMLGGKGGFGSLLKGQPPVKKRTNNFDSCRDLSGRRIRHVNQEKMLQEWQLKKQEEENMLKEFETGDDAKEALISVKKEETNKLNQKFIQETNHITNSVTASIKYLLKKKQRDVNKPVNIVAEKEIKIENGIKVEPQNSRLDIEQLEKELFSL